jgi:hypothetical protein
VPTVSKEVKATTTQIASERLKRLRHQNSKLALELRKIRGQVGDLDKIRREVLAANSIVRQQILAVPVRDGPALGLTREQVTSLTAALVEALNDLAYEREKNETDGRNTSIRVVPRA